MLGSNDGRVLMMFGEAGVEGFCLFFKGLGYLCLFGLFWFLLCINTFYLRKFKGGFLVWTGFWSWFRIEMGIFRKRGS